MAKRFKINNVNLDFEGRDISPEQFAQEYPGLEYDDNSISSSDRAQLEQILRDSFDDEATITDLLSTIEEYDDEEDEEEEALLEPDEPSPGEDADHLKDDNHMNEPDAEKFITSDDTEQLKTRLKSLTPEQRKIIFDEFIGPNNDVPEGMDDVTAIANQASFEGRSGGNALAKLIGNLKF